MQGGARSRSAAPSRPVRRAGPDSHWCDDWTTRDLVAHLVIRERRSDAAVGICQQLPVFAVHSRVSSITFGLGGPGSSPSSTTHSAADRAGRAAVGRSSRGARLQHTGSAASLWTAESDRCHTKGRSRTPGRHQCPTRPSLSHEFSSHRQGSTRKSRLMGKLPVAGAVVS